MRQVSDIEAKHIEAHREALDRADKDEVTRREHMLAYLIAERDRLISHLQNQEAEYQAHKDATASSSKPRGQWIASLMNSGALPTWNWAQFISQNGPVMSFSRKNEMPPEERAGVTISELELYQHFEEGVPYHFSSPTPLPPKDIKAVIESASQRLENPFNLPKSHLDQFLPSKTSILGQIGVSAPVELPDGSTGSKTTIINYLVDGTQVTKEFVQQPAELLEEMQNARTSMDYIGDGIRAISEELSEEQRGRGGEGVTPQEELLGDE